MDKTEKDRVEARVQHIMERHHARSMPKALLFGGAGLFLLGVISGQWLGAACGLAAALVGGVWFLNLKQEDDERLRQELDERRRHRPSAD